MTTKYLCRKTLFNPYNGELVFEEGKTYEQQGTGDKLCLCTPGHPRVSYYPVVGTRHDWSDLFEKQAPTYTRKDFDDFDVGFKTFPSIKSAIMYPKDDGSNMKGYCDSVCGRVLFFYDGTNLRSKLADENVYLPESVAEHAEIAKFVDKNGYLP